MCITVKMLLKLMLSISVSSLRALRLMLRLLFFPAVSLFIIIFFRWNSFVKVQSRSTAAE